MNRNRGLLAGISVQLLVFVSLLTSCVPKEIDPHLKFIEMLPKGSQVSEVIGLIQAEQITDARVMEWYTSDNTQPSKSDYQNGTVATIQTT
jgi:hypothetical protein